MFYCLFLCVVTGGGCSVANTPGVPVSTCSAEEGWAAVSCDCTSIKIRFFLDMLSLNFL